MQVRSTLAATGIRAACHFRQDNRSVGRGGPTLTATDCGGIPSFASRGWGVTDSGAFAGAPSAGWQQTIPAFPQQPLQAG